MADFLVDRFQMRVNSLLRVLRSDMLNVEIAKNVGISSGVKMASMGSGMLMQIVLARTLGVREFGVYTVVWALIIILLIPGKLGFDLSSIRFVSQYRARQEWDLVRGYIRSAILVAILSSSIVGLLSAAVLGLLSVNGLVEFGYLGTYLVGLLILPVFSLVAVNSGILRGLDRLSQSLISQNVVFPLGVSTLLPVTGYFSQTPDAKTGLVTCGVVLVAVCCLQLYLIVRALSPGAKSRKASYDTKNWIKTSVTIGGGAGLEQLIAQIDVLLLGSLVGATFAGVYAVAVRFTRLVNLGLQISNQSTAHMLSGLYAEGRIDRLQKVVSLTALMSAATSIPLLVVFFLFPSQMLSLFGEVFSQQGAALFQILLLGQFANAVAGPNGVVMYMTGHHNAMFWILLSTLVVSVLSIVLLLQIMDVVGVAYAASLAMVFRNVVTTWQVKRRLGIDTTVFSFVKWNRLQHT